MFFFSFRKAAQKWHPDNFPDGDEKKKAEKKFIDVAAAKEVLTDPGNYNFLLFYFRRQCCCMLFLMLLYNSLFHFHLSYMKTCFKIIISWN
jgi:hypothetical protein